MVAQGRSEARRCGVVGEGIEDFLSEYLLGCHFSPDPKNQALTCVCGNNRARSFMRKERCWKQRVTLAETAQIQWLIDSGRGIAVGKSPDKEPSNRVTPEGHALLQELQSRLLTAMSELTELQQKVLYLRLIEGLSFAEVAAQTCQSSVAARMSLRNGQRRLGALLESSDFPCGEACEYLSALNRSELS
ncbi:sigma-70 family RNA polymerase sigma factor [Armatimonas sp.]|uniref:RNA polymerase sigma factor n=1 Tax=Armatimonas sp. TaxID=1872638 RepID=UPI00286A400A|nr:sigma-70 family RNA polymerase sigma factor [Armatimonas sp.]